MMISTFFSACLILPLLRTVILPYVLKVRL